MYICVFINIASVSVIFPIYFRTYCDSVIFCSLFVSVTEYINVEYPN